MTKKSNLKPEPLVDIRPHYKNPENFAAGIKANRENNFQIYNPENMVTKHIRMWE